MNQDDSTAMDTDDPQLATGRRPPTMRVSFSHHVRPSRSRLNPENGPPGTPTIAQTHAGVPLGERVYSIPESTARMSISIPTALAKPEATPLPPLPLIVLCITMMGEFLTANVSTPWALFMVESFGVEPADVGLWTGILISVFFITQFLTSLIWASIAERFGRRIVLVISLLGSGVSCIAFGTSKTLEFALATRLLQGVFGGAVGVARSSVASISDSTNEAQAYAILGFCWGLGGVAGAIIGGICESPAKKWQFFARIPVFVEYPYLLPTVVAASITIVGGLLALALDYDGGSRLGAPNSTDSEYTPLDAEAGITAPSNAEHGLHTPGPISRPPVNDHSVLPPITENTPLHNSTSDAPPVEGYGAAGASAIAAEQLEHRIGVPFGERTWTLSSAVSGNSGYGEPYRSRFGNGPRRRFSATSLVSAAARRRLGGEDGPGDMYAGNEADGQEPWLAERMVAANEFTVTSIGDLWVASALTMDAEDDDLSEFEDENFLLPGDNSMIPTNTARPAPITEHRARSVSATRRVAPSGSVMSRDNRPYSLALTADNSTSRLGSYPAIFQNTGLRSPSPGFDFVAEGPDTCVTGANTIGVDVLQPIIEGKPIGYEAQGASAPSLFSQLPLVIIFQYGLLALHGTTHDQVFMSYVMSDFDRGGLQLDAGDFAQLIAIMCLAQIFYQFYLYPMMGPPLGRFSHLSMFRIGGVLLLLSYLSAIIVRPLAKAGVDGRITMGVLTLGTAIRYCGITFSYTSVMVLLNYMCAPHTLGLANGLAQSVVSLARFVGPILGGYLWSFSTYVDPEGYSFGFWFCGAFCVLALLHSFTLH